MSNVSQERDLRLAFVEAACIAAILGRTCYVVGVVLAALHEAGAGVDAFHLLGQVDAGAGITELAEALTFAATLASALGATAVLATLHRKAVVLGRIVVGGSAVIFPARLIAS